MVVAYCRRSLDYCIADESVVAHQCRPEEASVSYNVEEKRCAGKATHPDVGDLAAEGQNVLIAHHDFGDSVCLDT